MGSVKLSRISTLHYIKLVFRSVLFLTASILYIISWANDTDEITSQMERRPFLLIFIGLFFTVEMVLRFFPSRLESMGCQKQFAQNYLPAESRRNSVPDKRQSNKSVPIVAAAWILLNAVVGALYFLKVLTQGALILICLAYSVCDMICILFFCPFQTLILKNKCCGSCRIYNWDYAMMFTPLIFIPSIFTWSLLAISISLLVKWEITYHRHPERFSEATNASLSCANCEEKLCAHKKSLQRFWKRQRKLGFRYEKSSR